MRQLSLSVVALVFCISSGEDAAPRPFLELQRADPAEWARAGGGLRGGEEPLSQELAEQEARMDRLAWRLAYVAAFLVSTASAITLYLAPFSL